MSAQSEFNLDPRTFPHDLKWDDESTACNLDKIYGYVDNQCTEAIAWYYKKKIWKRRFGYWLRFLAIGSTAISGIIPILTEIYKIDGEPFISPIWSTFALAIAALLIAIDRFGGYTSGWVRFVRTAQNLTEAKSKHELLWSESKANLQLNPNANKSPAPTMLSICQKYAAAINLIIRNETNEWAREFQGILAELERQLQQKDNGKP